MSNLKCNRRDCFGNYSRMGCGRCMILRDTNFNGKPCPFFKTSEQYQKEIAKEPKKEEFE